MSSPASARGQGAAPSSRVDVSMDGGANCETARLDSPSFDKSAPLLRRLRLGRARVAAAGAAPGSTGYVQPTQEPASGRARGNSIHTAMVSGAGWCSTGGRRYRDFFLGRLLTTRPAAASGGRTVRRPRTPGLQRNCGTGHRRCTRRHGPAPGQDRWRAGETIFRNAYDTCSAIRRRVDRWPVLLKAGSRPALGSR